MEEIAKIVINNYPRRIQTAKKAKPIFYILNEDNYIITSEKNKVLPLKYLKKEYKKVAKYANPSMLKEEYSIYAINSKKEVAGNYNFKNRKIEWFDKKIVNYKLALFDNRLPEIILANPKVAYNARYLVIKGQDFYSGNIHPFTRVKVVNELHFFFEKEIIKQCPIITKYPIIIKCELHDYFEDDFANGQAWDIDNRIFIYNKTFLDSLKNTGKIIDDNRQYIIGSPGCIFIPINPLETPKLIYTIFHVNYSQYAEYNNNIDRKFISDNDINNLY